MKKKRAQRIIQLIIAMMLILLVGVLFTQLSEEGRWGSATPTTTTPIVTESTPPPATEKPKPKQGSIIITSLEEETGLPIAGAEFAIANVVDGGIVETIRTDVDGKARSMLLDYGTVYNVRQVAVANAYDRDEAATRVAINAPSQEVTTENKLRGHIKEIVRGEDGRVEIASVYMDVPVIMQKPELPNGCEITSLTAAINYYGFEADKLDMADNFLPKESWIRRDGKLFGPDPFKAYAGNPRDQPGGFFSFAPPIVAAADKYMSEVGGNLVTTDISGSTREELMDKLMDGIPVVAWTTLDLSSPPRINYSWHFHDTGELYNAPVNLHVIVLNGYDVSTNTIHIMNPLEGQVAMNADTFFKSYEDMGSHALIVEG